MLPRAERLTRRKDFAAVYARRKSWANALLVLYIRRHAEGEASGIRRFGFSVSKKVGKAHDRNRIKRRLRAVCRAHGAEWRSGFDAVWVVRAAAADADYAALEAAAADLMARARLFI